MLALGIELLSGRYVASAYNDREKVEWPPHPARLFSALVAAWGDGDIRDAQSNAEANALRWLETLPAPEILASSIETAGLRDAMPVFVPVNDISLVSLPNRDKLDDATAALAVAVDAKSRTQAEKLVRKLEEKLAVDTKKAIAAPTKPAKSELKAAEQIASDRRVRQPRSFPSACPEVPNVAFVWSEATMSSDIRQALARLLSRVVRIGHSSSLVRVYELDDRGVQDLAGRVTRHCPDNEEGSLSIRWIGPGQLEALVRAYDQHRETEPRVLPARFVRYRDGERNKPRKSPVGVFADDFIVLARTSGPRLPITSSVGVSRQFRRALMASADEPIHEMISGHKQNGDASEVPHLAIVPLPVVSGPHADGALIGLGLILPRDTDATARRAVMRAIGRLEANDARDSSEAPPIVLRLGDAGILELQRIAWGEDRRATLRPSTWTRSSRRWASATPVALDRNPGDLLHADDVKRRQAFEEATRTVSDAVERIGLPRPVEIDVVRSCVVNGAAKPRAYPRFPIDTKRPQRVLVHVRLVFAEPVRGPIIIGAGRYHGLGLCLPVDGQAALS